MSDLKSLTRRELYDLLWKKPVDTLAKEFGISGRGLGKLCERYSIPVPPRGYWERKAARQKPVKAPLLEIEGRHQADVAIRIFRTPLPTEEERGRPDYFRYWHQQSKEIGDVKVPERLMKPHPIVARWLTEDVEERKRTRQGGWGSHNSLKPPRETPLGNRRLRIFDAMFKWL
ncbi:hypothetical protein FZC33_15895 [Labrys sp. KNU-23]|uniref:hypothetical protein n=1 Tax=Labrys sp. KNU-23 TaxID=2789216 RepID=UPI0011EF527D|nr:hypothetical protein [Labrys sp. KNU-23]QEN87709.1 hypothetical protein FZC33_15895 [Labrys sp. KNU-23]